MTVGVWALTAALTVGLFLALWASVVRSDRREDARRRDVEIELQQWAMGKGWDVSTKLPQQMTNRLCHVYPSEHLLLTAHGDHGGQRCVVLVYEAGDDGGYLRYVVCLLWLRQPRARLRVTRWVYGLARNPPLPDGAGQDPDFDRRLRVDRHTGAEASNLLIGPVRVALLRLAALLPPHEEVVLIDSGILRTVVNAWPPRVDLDAVLSGMAEVAAALPAGPSPVPQRDGL